MFRGRFKLKLNVEYRLFDKFGIPKKLFSENWLWRLFHRMGYVMPQVPLLFGQWAYSKRISNLVTDAGKAGVASRINGSGAEAVFDYIAVGTGTTAAAAGNTTLETESAASGLSRAQATVSRVTTDVTNDTARDVKTFSVTGTVAVTESGVLNAAAAGVLLARQVFSAINVVNGDSLQITWNFDVD